jgi:nitrogen regulatory protein PII
MKLVIITSSIAFQKDIKTLLKKADVKTYSFREVTGYMDFSDTATPENWFASEVNETESILFYAFVKKENVDQLFKLITEFNTAQESLSHIHIAVLNIEKSNNPTI